MRDDKPPSLLVWSTLLVAALVLYASAYRVMLGAGAILHGPEREPFYKLPGTPRVGRLADFVDCCARIVFTPAHLVDCCLRPDLWRPERRPRTVRNALPSGRSVLQRGRAGNPAFDVNPHVAGFRPVIIGKMAAAPFPAGSLRC